MSRRFLVNVEHPEEVPGESNEEAPEEYVD